MPKFDYHILLSLDLGNAFAPVGDMLNHVNAELSMFGYSEQLSVRSKIIRVTLTSERELTKEDREKVKTELTSQFASAHPAWNVKVESFRRKSGNVQQSVQ